MSLWQKVVVIANKAMNTEANQILGELKAECPRSSTGHNGRHVADSFRIMGKGEGAMVSVSGSGLIGSIRIGSTELGAYYADQGNGGRGRIIHPTHAKALRLKDGTIRKSVHGYEGTHFVREVADRHR